MSLPLDTCVNQISNWRDSLLCREALRQALVGVHEAGYPDEKTRWKEKVEGSVDSEMSAPLCLVMSMYWYWLGSE